MPFDQIDGKLSLKALDKLLTLAEKCDVCVIGPGMGRSEESDLLAIELLGRIACPVVLDADGINAVSGNINVLIGRSSNGMKTVLTPHDVEFERLGGSLSGGRLKGSLDLAALTGSTVVLKGNTTITASPDGTAYVNTSGNPGMAKGGSGDLLAGIIASLAGQGLDLCRASAAGAFIHGAAGDLAASSRGEYGMLPTDLLSEIPAVLKKYVSKEYGGGA
jgi:NAD(P)H-hydrate epimerase